MSFPLLRAAYSQKKKKRKENINCSNNIPPWYGSFRKLAEILILFYLTIEFELQTFKTKC